MSLQATISAVDTVFADQGHAGPDRQWPPAIPATLWPNAPLDTIGMAFPVLYGEKSDEGARDPITNALQSKGLIPLWYIGQQAISDLGGTSPDPPDDGTQDVTIDVPVIVSTTNAVRAADNPGGWTASTYIFIRAIVNGVRGPWSAVPPPFDPAGVTEPQGVDLFVHTNAIQIDGADQPGGQTTVVYELRASDDATYHPETNPTVGLRGSATHDDLTKDSYYGDSDYSTLIKPDAADTIGSGIWDAYLVTLGAGFRIIGLYGSDLGGSDPTKTHDRTKLVLAERNGSDLLCPWDDDGNADPNWPFADTFVTYTDPDTGIAYDCLVIFARGPLSDDAKNGVVNFTCNAVGRMAGGRSGLPLLHAHRVQQCWFENDLFLDWTADVFCDNTTAPMFRDGVYKVKSSTFTARQNFTIAALGGLGLTVGWYVDKAKSVSEWIREWNRSTETRIGRNGHGQIVLFGLDETIDPTEWPRLDHDPDFFGPVSRVGGEERENVVTGSCDWDSDAEQFRIGPITYAASAAIVKYKNRRKEGDPVESTILNDEAQLRWVLQRRLARLQEGTAQIEVTVSMRGADLDVGSGVLLNSLEGQGASGWANHPAIIMRRRFDLRAMLVTFTLWDVKNVLLATAFENGLDRILYETDDDDLAPVETDDDDLAPLEVL